MIRIYICDEKKLLKNNGGYKEAIKKAVNSTTRYLEKNRYIEGLEDVKEVEISVNVTDNEGILGLNREYRGQDKPTDVLSFPAHENIRGGGRLPVDMDGVCRLGDIVISLEKCEAQSVENGVTAEREIVYLTVHSVLHLFGYDHEVDGEEAEAMFGVQDEIMGSILG